MATIIKDSQVQDIHIIRNIDKEEKDWCIKIIRPNGQILPGGNIYFKMRQFDSVLQDRCRAYIRKQNG